MLHQEVASRAVGRAPLAASREGGSIPGGEDVETAAGPAAEDVPHARGPDEIGFEDTGAVRQREGGGLDMEAAVGRAKSPPGKGEGMEMHEEKKADELEVKKDGDGDVVVGDADAGERGVETAAS